MLACVMLCALVVDPPETVAPEGPPPPAPASVEPDHPLDPDAIPPTGKFWIVSGSVVSGSALLWGGSFVIASSFSGTGGQAGPPTPEDLERQEAMQLRSNIAIGVNAGFFAVGVGAIALGAVQDHRFAAWRRSTGQRPPSNGDGLLGAGTGVLTAGVVYVGSVGPFFLYDSYPNDKAMFGAIAGAYAVAGTALLVTGAVKRKRVNARLRSNYELAVRPLAPGAFQFGLTRAAN